MYSQEAQRQFLIRCRRGLIYIDCSLPTTKLDRYYGKTDRQAFSKKMMFEDLRELAEQPEPQAVKEKVVYSSGEFQQLKAQVNFLTNKVMEKRVEKNQKGSNEPF